MKIVGIKVSDCIPTTMKRHSQRVEEFELIKHALYSDPNDQSVWLYHRWLVGEGSPWSKVSSPLAHIIL